MKKILIIEKDINLGYIVKELLETNHYIIRYQLTGVNIIYEIEDFKPDLIMLDIYSEIRRERHILAQHIRGKVDTPVFFVIQNIVKEDIDLFYSIRNVDYISKPFNMCELYSRIAKLLNEQVSVQFYNMGKHKFIPCQGVIQHEKDQILLTKLEVSLLKILCENEGRFISRRELTQIVWNNSDPKINENSLNNVISRLRKKLYVINGFAIETRNGMGVRARY